MIGLLLPSLTFAAALGAGLAAGLFFAFSAFIMKALGRLPAEQGIAAMQSINVTVLNPVFGTVFFGTALLCLVLGMVSLFRWNEPVAMYLLIGSLLYVFGTFAVTATIHVPMNNELAGVATNGADRAALWAGYLVRWTAWNHVRTISALLALASFINALRR
jgi:uncharacterized membrane protein